MYTRLSIKFVVVMLLLMGIHKGNAQTVEEVSVLNNYIEFLNESVHGLAVAQILFVNYNKDLNKYIDLESHKINTHIDNSELGRNIFDNADITTTDNNQSALKLSQIIKTKSKLLNKKTAKVLNGYMVDIVFVLNNINDLRFDIEDVIKSTNLNDQENIHKAYELLEKAVSYFEKYEQLHSQLADRLRREVIYSYKPMDFIFYEVHSATNSMLKEFRRRETTNLDVYVSRISGAMSNYQASDFQLTSSQKAKSAEIVKQVNDMLKFVERSKDENNIPDSYKNYGVHYYRHNSLLLSYFNSISPGFISKMNKLLSERDSTFLHYDDKPIIYKVTYPKKLSKNYIELEFFDPNIYDGDTISVQLNDEVLLDGHRLEREPAKFKLDIDISGDNSLLIFAKNEGLISPNTVGFKYRYNGKGPKKEVIKKLDANEAYELILSIKALGGLSDQ